MVIIIISSYSMTAYQKEYSAYLCYHEKDIKQKALSYIIILLNMDR